MRPTRHFFWIIMLGCAAAAHGQAECTAHWTCNSALCTQVMGGVSSGDSPAFPSEADCDSWAKSVFKGGGTIKCTCGASHSHVSNPAATCGPTAPVNPAAITNYLNQAQVAYGRRDGKEQFEKTKQAALLGDWGAQRALGLMYYRGRGTTQDANLAVRCLLTAASQGDPVAKTRLADMYGVGYGPLRKDYLTAFALADDAARSGQPSAFCEVGKTLANMNPPDPSAAVQFFDAGIRRGEKRYCAEGRSQTVKHWTAPTDQVHKEECWERALRQSCHVIHEGYTTRTFCVHRYDQESCFGQ